MARGADPEDLNPPERTGQGAIDLAELEARVVRAENALNAAHKGLQNLIARITTTTTAEMLRTALLKLGAFGVGPAVPVSVAGEEPEAISRARAAGPGAAEDQRSAAGSGRGAARSRRSATDQRGRREQLVARMRAVFGPSFVVLPRFTFDAAGATEFDERAGGEHAGTRRRSAGGATRGSRAARGCAMAWRASARACSARKCSAPARAST